MAGRFLLVLHSQEVCLLGAAWGLISLIAGEIFIFGILTFFKVMSI